MRCFARVVRTAALIGDRPAEEVKSATRAFRLRLRHSAYGTPFSLPAPSRHQHSLVNPVSATSCAGRGPQAAPALAFLRSSIHSRLTFRLRFAQKGIQQESHMKRNECGPVVRLVSSTVVLILAILASPALAQTADRPVVKVGDEWQFMQYTVTPVQKPNLVWVITSATPTGIAGTSNGKPLSLTPDLNIIESPTRKFSDRRNLSFPLEIGKSWTYSTHVELKDLGGTLRQDAGVTVAAYEKVIVRAGLFDAFKIEAKGKWEGAGTGTVDFTDSYWYAPSARAIVKQVYWDSRFGERVLELASFKLQP